MASKKTAAPAASVPAKRESQSRSTALAVIPRSNYMALADGSEAAEALRANLVPGEKIQEQDLVRVPLPSGGATIFTVNDISGQYHTESVEGVLVYFGYRRLLWPSEEPTGQPPVCVSEDLMTGRTRDMEKVAPELLPTWEIGEGACDRCPFNAFGSSSKGKGKRCKEVRLLFLLRQDDPMPMMIGCPPGSLRNVSRFIKLLPIPHWRAVVSLGLESHKNEGGQPYARLVPTLLGTLDKETGALVKGMYTDHLTKFAKYVDVKQSDIGGEAGEPSDV
jgi:hypothetical protein